MDMYLRYIAMIFVFINSVSFAEKIPITVTTGVYWKLVDQAVIYEASVPLVYKGKWPGVDVAHLTRPQENGFCGQSLNDPQCVLYSWLLHVDKEIGTRIQWLNESTGEEASMSRSIPSSREARSIKFLGSLAHWCCGIVTSRQLKPMFTNQAKMSEYEKGLELQVEEAFAEIDNVTLGMTEYSRQMEQTFARVIDVGVNISKVIDRFQRNMFASNLKADHKSFSLLQISTHHVIRQIQTVQLISRLEILSQCREKKLPTTIVSLSKLKSDLLSLTNSIQEDGYELVIPVDEITKYLKLEIADCIISDDDILVHLKIPIKRQGSQWRLYELLAVPFAWENKTCTIQHAAPFLAVDGERLMTIQGPAMHDCQPYGNAMCYVPRYIGDAASGSYCPRKMFLGGTIQELSSLCVFSCIPGQTPLVSKINELKYVLTHVTGRLHLRCRHGNNETIDINERKLGAVEIRVACDCQLSLGSQVLVAEAYPCSKKPTESEVIHIVPAAWSKLKTLKLSPQHTHAASTFETLDECLDSMWPTQVPHWNLSFSGRSHSYNPPPTISLPRPEHEMFTLVLTVIHVLYFIIVSIIVLRNPHLVGIGYGVPARAENGLDVVINEKYIYDIMYCILTTLSLICLWYGMIKLRYWWSARRGSSDVAMTAKKELDDSENLPRNMPITEVDGKELRITLEWWSPTVESKAKVG